MPMPNFGGKPSTQQIKSDVREGIVEHAESGAIVDQKIPPEPVYDESATDTEDRITGSSKLSKLVADDFPFDESQLAAVDGMVQSQYACLTGAAGTGKTTTTKKLVDMLMSTTRIGTVDMRQYWSREVDERLDAYNDGDDDYEYDENNSVIPTIVMGAFTGRATQMIKKNFPRDWHGNIMTIHRMLGFVPETYEDWDPEWENDDGTLGAYRNKIRFVPTYNEAVRMPWDIYLIDEAGMLGLDLWHQFLAAVKDGARIYLIGDINQLQPVHGKSVFGFAMARWPAFELTKVHRQQGVDNPIVDNAWRVIHGQRPVSEGKFQMIELPGDSQLASRKVRAIANKLKEMAIYDPIRDSIITPINGDKMGSGYALGQIPLNREFALMFNPESEHPRYLIDGGREKKQFAVGDKVMATRNDWEAGITNGMTGIITSIKQHEGYSGDRDRFGLITEVNARYADESEEEFMGDDFDLESLESSMIAKDAGRKAKKEKRERGPSSHIVTVQFGSGTHAFEIPFETLAEVGSLQTAYVSTCHKMQGGEAPTIIIILHESHRRMHYREWLYTAITRASEKCILLYTDLALRVALNKQSIKGANLREKVQSFNELIDPTGEAQKMVQLPVSDSTALTILDRPAADESGTAARLTTEEEKKGGLAQLIANQKKKADEQREQPTITQEVHIHVSRVEIKNMFSRVANPTAPTPTPRETLKDGGEIRGQHDVVDRTPAPVVPSAPERPALPAPPQHVSQWGAVRMLHKLRDASDSKLLTYQPRNEANDTVILIDGSLEDAKRVEEQRESRKEAQLGTLFKPTPKVEEPKRTLASLFGNRS